MSDYQIRSGNLGAAREIKASAHYAYIANGITLDGTKFAANELVLEGQCLVRDTTSGKYEKAGAAMTGKDNPCILDESVQFAQVASVNKDQVVGQVIVHSAGVHTGMLKDCTAAFKTAAAAAGIRFV